MTDTAGIEELAETLVRRDWAVHEGFLDAERVAALRAEAAALEAAGGFRTSGVGHGAAWRPEVRGDEIAWITREQAPLVWALSQDELEVLRLAINAHTYLGLHELEAHYAVYPPGAFYARHLDRFREDNQRVVSLVLYLNEAWGAEDGGELQLYPSSAEVRVSVAPSGGTLVCFLSERVPHEVLPARRTRYSLAGWFRRRD